MGFANSIIGGAAALIRAAIKSPNYVAGVSGWSINKDGTAEFQNITAHGNSILVGDLAGDFAALSSDGAGISPFGKPQVLAGNGGATQTLACLVALNGSFELNVSHVGHPDNFLVLQADQNLAYITQPLSMDPGGWSDVAYPSGWSTVAGFNKLQYRRDGTGRIWFRGCVQIAASNAAGNKFTMPSSGADYRPQVKTMIAVPMGPVGANNPNVQQRFDIDATTGVVNMVVAAPAANQFTTWDGISYHGKSDEAL